MPSLRSNRRIIIVAGAVAAIIAILALAISAQTSGSIQVCENPPTVSLTHVTGFAMIQSRPASYTLKQDTDLSIQPVGRYEFVLKPGSVGHVKMVYDFCPNAFLTQPSRTANYSELNKLFQSRSSPNEIIYKLNDKPDNNTSSTGLSITSSDKQLLSEVLNATDVGLRIFPSDLTRLGIHSLAVTYIISAEPDADKATYVITNFYGICPGELLTIGDTPNEKSIQWAKGPFYGCGG